MDGITRARLIDQSGRVVRDDVEAGVALFLWEGEFGLHEASGELADAGGAVLRTGPLFVNG